jgi:CubicO group peptidase (beta-lactamase class C family)
MNADELAHAVLRRGVAQAVAAGCAARRDVQSGWSREVGGAAATLFDLASLTKPMTAVSFVRAGIDPSTPLGALVVEARGTASESVPLELLLAHRAGLAAHRTLYAPLLSGSRVDRGAALREAADARRPEASGPVPSGGFEPLYSDLGYVLAGEAVARATGARDAGEAIDRLVLAPLGIESQAGTVRDLASRGVDGPFAPTEEVAWRGGVVSGAVHDENAWALSGLGGSGHAGIFGTIDAVLEFGSAVLDALKGRGAFGDRSLQWLVRERDGGTLRAGFDGKTPVGSSAGSRMGPRTFGHLGFTGTSLWLDPDAQVVVALLTNRVFPTREHLAIRDARPWAHDALFDRAVLLP